LEHPQEDDTAFDDRVTFRNAGIAIGKALASGLYRPLETVWRLGSVSSRLLI
jgi:hypothetical protein